MPIHMSGQRTASPMIGRLLTKTKAHVHHLQSLNFKGALEKDGGFATFLIVLLVNDFQGRCQSRRMRDSC